ncbi:MAG: hypothetical protein J6D03_08550 [Clostridia bacterium]|nr:hypothetical protein [Clostridia bacterium]
MLLKFFLFEKCQTPGFSKEFREIEESKLLEEVQKYMKEFDMIIYNKEMKEYTIMPICFKIIGKYPKDFLF